MGCATIWTCLHVAEGTCVSDASVDTHVADKRNDTSDIFYKMLGLVWHIYSLQDGAARWHHNSHYIL